MRTIGIITGAGSGSQDSASLGQLLKSLDEAISRFSLPLETRTLDQIPDDPSEYAGLLIGRNVSAYPVLRECGAQILASPLDVRMPGLPSSLLIWPFEDRFRVQTARSSPAETWVETSSLPRHTVEAAARVALQLARERDSRRLIWAYAGWGETESLAMSTAREAIGPAIEDLPFEKVLDLLSAREGANVVLSLSRTALCLARAFGAAGWIAWSENPRTSPVIAQAANSFQANRVLALFLDRLGYVKEAASI